MDWFNLSLTLPVTDPTWIFLLVLLIILFAPILLNKLRIPHIIGMILAGLVIGEHGFNILVRDSSFELFGKVGLYYIMFLAGLEMNMGDFKKNRGRALCAGAAVLERFVPVLWPGDGGRHRLPWRLCAGADYAAKSAAADGLRVGIRSALSGLFALGGLAAVELPGGYGPETGEAAAVQGTSAG